MVRGEFLHIKKDLFWGFPGGSVVKNPPANAGKMSLIPVQEDPTFWGATKPKCHDY